VEWTGAVFEHLRGETFAEGVLFRAAFTSTSTYAKSFGGQAKRQPTQDGKILRQKNEKQGFAKTRFRCYLSGIRLANRPRPND